MQWSINAGLLSPIAALCATSALAQPIGDVLDCVGPFGKHATEATMRKAFGAENVAVGDIDIGENTMEAGTIIFPADPKRRIEILWHDNAGRQRPRSIALTGLSTWVIAAPAPDPRRFGLGADLAQIEAINGRPFLLNGFGWVNGGLLYDLRRGALEDGRACRLGLRFDPDEKAKPSVVERVSSGRRFSSSDPAMRAAKPKLSSIELSWPDIE
jgi:hypothetical protein